ncbi:beta-glucuronidase [Coraliomargarita parva]|uniref:beta-glucuronidase n=1 Tax=Coraliomargarita parva TaxID=3014050 RepID=UPI0022B58D3A|nr:beta-glucuronidase [Coraliomargarita parva]
MLYPKRTQTRDLFELNGIWNFARELDESNYAEGFTAEKQVAVPGSYNDLFTDNEFRTWEKGTWYARSFQLPRMLRSERIVLRFGSVSYRAEVYLNGQHLGGHETGYTPFEFDITELAKFDDENLLCVRVENTLSNETVPMGNLQNKPEAGQFAGQYPDTPFDFFPYAGIQRPVAIYTTPKTAWLDQVAVETTYEGNTGHVSIGGRCCGQAAKAFISVQGTEASTTVELHDQTFASMLKIESVQLWGVNRPNLYQARIQLIDTDGNVLDDYTQQFGVRTVKVDGNRILLNEKPVYLQGFGRHEDFHIIGKGLNHSVNIRDHELLKWIHANSYRTTHYPYSEELIQLADEQGILLIAEAPAVSINFDYVNEQTLKAHKKVLAELIERDRNNPSVIMWSVANEATTDRPESIPYFKELSELVRSMDSTRPVTMISCKGADDLVMDFFDVVGVNTYPGWYHLPGQVDAAKEHLRASLKQMHEQFRKPILITEFGADTIAGMHSLPVEQWSEEYQTELILGLIEVMREMDFVVGEHIWNFADFRTAQGFARVGGNKKGVFTRERQPKMVAHFLKKFWSKPRYED